MKDLEKWQIISFLSRGVAMALGIIQGIFVVRILSVSEYGMVGIVAAIGSIVGVSQHLGLASGSTREISAAKDDKEVFKIFYTSSLIRYSVTIPLAIGLLLTSRYLAIDKYSNPELLTPIRLYALVLLVQAIQSMFNSVISGTQRFKQLFIYQAVISFVSVALYIPLVYLFKVNGYFIALAIFNLIASVALGTIALYPIRKSIEFPSKAETKHLLKEILSISLGIYLVKVVFTLWQRLGPLLLGLHETAEVVGIFSFALFYATKLMAVSDAVTDVNLPALSKQYANDIESFKKVFSSNFDKVFAFIVFSAITAVYWVNEIVRLAIGSDKYDLAIPLILPMVFAFIFYSFVNIIKSSVIVPAKMVKEMVMGYFAMAVSTIGFYFFFKPSFGSLMAMAMGMACGALVGVVVLTFYSQLKLRFNFFSISHVLIVIQGLVIALSGGIENFTLKVLAFVLFTGLYFFSLYAASFVTKDHLAFLNQKIKLINKVLPWGK